MNFSDLKGKVLTKIEVNKDSDEITFYDVSGDKYTLYHSQDCCEVVNIEDICGDLDDLLGSEILLAEEVSHEDEDASESATWTFYKLSTIKGSVTIRWYGESNGYYSESVDFRKVENNE